MSPIEVATSFEVATSSQPERLEVPTTGMTSEGITTATEEPSSHSSLPKDLSSLDPQLGKRIKILYILPFSSSLLISTL